MNASTHPDKTGAMYAVRVIAAHTFVTWVPILFITHLSNTWYFVVLKILLGIFLIAIITRYLTDHNYISKLRSTGVGISLNAVLFLILNIHWYRIFGAYVAYTLNVIPVLFIIYFTFVNFDFLKKAWSEENSDLDIGCGYEESYQQESSNPIISHAFTVDNPERAEYFNSMLAQKNYDEALKYLESFKDKYPKDGHLLGYIGITYRFLGEFDKAISSYVDAITLEQDNFSAHLGLGIVYQLMGKYAESERSINNSIEIKGDIFAAYNSLGLTQKIMKKYDEAIISYKRAIDLIIDEKAKQITGQGEVIEEGGKRIVQYRNLPRLIEQAIKSNLDYAIVCNNLGTCYAESGDVENGRKWFREAIATTPNDVVYLEPHDNLDKYSS